MHHAHEVVARQLLQRRARADDRRIVEQAIEAAELAFDHGRQLVVLVWQGGFQVERDDHRLRMAGGFDLVVDFVQVGLGLAQQQHGGTQCCIGLGSRGTNATAGTGNQDDPALQQVGAGGVVEHGSVLRVRVGGLGLL